MSTTGTTELPSARLVSVSVVPDFDAPSELDTHNVMQWGQFVDHDITHTPLFRLSYGQRDGIKCCKDDGSGPISQLILHPECFPIGKLSLIYQPTQSRAHSTRNLSEIYSAVLRGKVSNDNILSESFAITSPSFLELQTLLDIENCL